MNSAVKNIVFWVVMAVTALLIWAVVRGNAGGTVQEYTFTAFINEIKKDNVKDVQIAGPDVTGTMRKPETKFKTTIPSNYPDLYKDLTDKNVSVVIKDSLREFLGHLVDQRLAHDPALRPLDFFHAPDAEWR